MFSDLPRVLGFPLKEGPEAFEGKVLHSMDYAMMDRGLASALTREKRVTVVGSQKSAIDVAVEVAERNVMKMAMFSKLVETYLTWRYPLKKYNMVPNHSLIEHFASCMTPTLPSNFYPAVEGGSLILKKSPSFRFCHTGLILDGGAKSYHPTDVVIFATGYESDEKLKNIFSSIYFQKCIAGSSYPLYSPSVLYTIEMRSKWLTQFLAGQFELPTIREMEDEARKWERCMRCYLQGKYKRKRFSVMLQIYCNDQLCRDMKCNPRRKNSLLAELFSGDGPSDYQNLTPES
ncbi:hypothetical protein NL676_025296 [Syzygium grande]|nr:hypothetical protein NL676_025296 [Syzygium grande]